MILPFIPPWVCPWCLTIVADPNAYMLRQFCPSVCRIRGVGIATGELSRVSITGGSRGTSRPRIWSGGDANINCPFPDLKKCHLEFTKTRSFKRKIDFYGERAMLPPLTPTPLDPISRHQTKLCGSARSSTPEFWSDLRLCVL